MKDTTIANTIISQLGNFGRLKAMVNARNFVNLGNGVGFKFSGSNKWNYIKITLNGLDLYDVTLMKLGKFEIKKQETREGANGLYAEDLKGFIEHETGLYLSL